MQSKETVSNAQIVGSVVRRYDDDLRCVVAPSPVEDVNEYVLEPMRAFLALPGKRLRPVLCEAGCLLAGGERVFAHNCALALESFHAAALIHDDIEDGAITRRGAAAFHVSEGIPLAINAGDYGIALALRLVLHDSLLTDDVKVRVLDEIADMAARTVEGQAMDIGWSRDDRRDVTVEECLLMIEGKSACYSCAAPLAIGGIVAGADRRSIDVLRRMGTNLGMAFQIRDDLGNLLQLGSQTGKDGVLDIIQGKRTVIVAHALEHSRDSKELADILASRTSDDAQVQRAVSIMEEAGSLAFAEDLVGCYCADARDLMIESFPSGEGSELLERVIVAIEEGVAMQSVA